MRLFAVVVSATFVVSCGSKESAKDSSSGSGGNSKKPVNVAFVTNNPSDFWQIARAGIKKAEQELGVTCDFQMPPDGTAADQQRIVEALLAKGVQGMAISPND